MTMIEYIYLVIYKDFFNFSPKIFFLTAIF